MKLSKRQEMNSMEGQRILKFEKVRGTMSTLE